MKYYILFNPLAGNGHGEERAHALDGILEGEKIYCDLTKITYDKLMSELKPEDKIVLCGGDGTLNRVINAVSAIPENEILYYPCGSGNDFYFDLTGKKNGDPIRINEYVVNLPTVTVNGKDYKFLNGIGYGIEGYCCEEGDRIRAEKPGATIDYTGIAIKGLLFKFSPRTSTVTVDGQTKVYKKAWISPTMNGRFIGGGMMIAPGQERISDDKKLSVLVFYGTGRLKTLMLFPTIFKGEHVKYTKNIMVTKGKEINVKFDMPTALQIDGETITGVTEYSARV